MFVVPWTTDTKHRADLKFPHTKFENSAPLKISSAGLTNSRHEDTGQHNKYICNYVINVRIILVIEKPGENGIFSGAV